jgi:hypothetical protein
MPVISSVFLMASEVFDHPLSVPQSSQKAMVQTAQSSPKNFSVSRSMAETYSRVFNAPAIFAASGGTKA